MGAGAGAISGLNVAVESSSAEHLRNMLLSFPPASREKLQGALLQDPSVDAEGKAASKVTLTYYKGRGRAETTRWMLAAAGIPFDNVCMSEPEDLDALHASKKLIFGQLPLLEIDGLGIVQSSAMMRYVAQKGNLLGKTLADEAKCGMVCGAVTDLMVPIMEYPFLGCKFGKEEACTEKIKATFEKLSPGLERIAAENGKPGFMAGACLTYADVLIAELLVAVDERVKDASASVPKLCAVRDAVLALPSVKAYLESDLRFPLPDVSYVDSILYVMRDPRASPPAKA